MISLNEFLKNATELYKKYNVEQYKKECDVCLESFGIDVDIISFEQFLDKNQENQNLDEMTLALEKITAKFNYADYFTKVLEARFSFEADRCNYYYCKKCKEFFESEKIIFDTIIREKIKQDISDMLEKFKESIFEILYEDENGTIRKIKTKFKPDVLTEDYIETSPIDIWKGNSLFDSFQLIHFYDYENKTWIPIALELIISIREL